MGGDTDKLSAERRRKLEALRAEGGAYPNDFRRDAVAADLHRDCGALDRDALEAAQTRVRVAGRLVGKRVMGKTSFAVLRDMSGDIQLMLSAAVAGDDDYRRFKTLDVGDIVGAVGLVTRTRTGELSVRVERLRLLVKSLHPLPEKFHGLADIETRHRKRYLDLIAGGGAREIFRKRSCIVAAIRDDLNRRGFLEVETPMMQPLPGGAAARPFVTRHHALDMPLYLRVAPELYLKRLVVGGLEKVYEINRNFRNEGVSARHNPEFTMLEFYQAYADYRDLMQLTGDLLRRVCDEVCGGPVVEFDGRRLDFSGPFDELRFDDAILRHNPALDAAALQDPARLVQALADVGVGANAAVAGVASDAGVRDAAAAGSVAKLKLELFEKTVEPRLEQPTFITAFPTAVSPLARRNDDAPEVADRFELFIAGLEVANGFSELNDADDQRLRFREQARERAGGDDEAMYYDADYIEALEYGLPPTAGEGIGIDRLVMLLTGAPSIRDVILFPQMRRRPDTGASGESGKPGESGTSDKPGTHNTPGTSDTPDKPGTPE
ncbi:MAG: lysine--tRNA ligase [Gammaproteobacteria bacterium]|nr:lysine--tRNA ligase [Gammaproteobacteria bacterium]